MARYGTQVQQTPVDMYNPLNVGFYSNILDKAQTNLNQGAAAQAKFMEDVYGEKYANQEAHDLAVKQAEQGISGLLDAPFVSPANVIKGISKAAQNYAPYKNLNARQMELIKQAEAFKLQHGANALMTDPSKISLTNEDGSLKTPEQLKFTGLNAEDIDKMFLTSEKGELTSKFDRKVKSDLPFKYKFETVEGLSPEQIEQRYGKEGKDAIRLAEQQIQATPQILDVFDGDKNKAIEYLRNRNLSTAGQFGQSVTSKYVDDDWSLYMAKKAAETPPATAQGDLFVATDDDIINPNIDVSTKAVVSNILGADTKVDWDNLQFDENGDVVKTKVKAGVPVAGGRYGATTSSGVAYKNEDYMQEKTEIETLRLKLMKSASNGNELMAYKNMSPRQLVEKTRQASNNTARYYGTRGLTVSDNLAMNVASPFVDNAGNYKDNTHAGLQYKDKKTGQWVDATPDMMIDKFKLSDPETKTTFQKELSNVTTNVVSFNDPKNVKLVGGISVKGEQIPVRFNPANIEIREMFEPQRQVQQVLLTPGQHKVAFNGVNYELNTTLDLNSPTPAYKTIVKNATVDSRLSKTPRRGQTMSDYEAATLEAEEIKNSYDSGAALLGNTNKYAMGYAENHNIVYRTENPKKAVPTQYTEE